MIIAFAGPSLTAADREADPEFDWRAPAEAGDLLRLGAEEGDIVCLIDGFFDHRPAVRHKEVLLLLSRGVVVLGASSIGALRAAEMAPFGMIGVGAIYRAYADGRLCGDDEVALVHAPQEWGWKGLSLPLVDCRANLHRALRAGVLGTDGVRRILRAARAIHYLDRDWPSLLDQAAMPADRRRAFIDWLSCHGASQKRIDALACLDVAREGVPAPARPPMVRTSLIRALARECGLLPGELA